VGWSVEGGGGGCVRARQRIRVAQDPAFILLQCVVVCVLLQYIAVRVAV